MIQKNLTVLIILYQENIDVVKKCLDQLKKFKVIIIDNLVTGYRKFHEFLFWNVLRTIFYPILPFQNDVLILRNTCSLCNQLEPKKTTQLSLFTHVKALLFFS